MTVVRALRGMYVFAELAQRGSFHATAESLGITRSSVSQQIGRLEAELGVQLVIRSTRSMKLTAEGAAFARRCRELANIADLAVDELHELSDRPRGPLVVTTPHALEAAVVLPAISQLTREFPDVLPRVITDDEPLEVIQVGIDVAVRVGPLPDSDLIAAPLGDLHEVIVASAAYLAAHGHPVEVRDLEGHRWIATGWQRRRAFVELINEGQSSSVAQREDLHVSTLPSAARMAESGLGLAFVPQVFGRSWLEAGRLVRVLPRHHVLARRVHALHAYGRRPSLKVRRFIELAKQHMSG